MKRREIFLKAGKETGRWTLTRETEGAPLQDNRQGDVLSHKREQNCGGEKISRHWGHGSVICWPLFCMGVGEGG